MTSQAERAMSFGSIAEVYNRVRPSPPGEAVDWLLPVGCQVAVDLAAGTGLLARALADRVPEVIAIEPDIRMGAVLRSNSPGVRVVAGRGEAIPLSAASADALFVSSAWHWLNPDVAVPEIARVLRDGGRLGVIWTSRDREVDWIRDLDWLREPRLDHRSARAADSPPAPRRPRRQVTLPDPALLTGANTASFTWTRTMGIDDFIDWIATYSALITADEGERASTLARVRAAVDHRLDGAMQIEVPMCSVCWRANRTSR